MAKQKLKDQNIMCLISHMARCTNVIRLGHLALHSGVASGLKKTVAIESDIFKIIGYDEESNRGEEKNDCRSDEQYRVYKL